MDQGRRWKIIVAATAVAIVASTVTIAWFRRTAPPWPAVVGVPYDIRLAADGCPIVDDQAPFVDSPGQLVPPGASDVMLCAIPTELYEPLFGASDQPRQRVLRLGVDDFVVRLNALPDRNKAWREWQRRHSGWWPDAAPAPMGEVCNSMGYSHTYSFVLRYPERRPIVLNLSQQCGTVTSGVRTRMDYGRPNLLEEFMSWFEEQARSG